MKRTIGVVIERCTDKILEEKYTKIALRRKEDSCIEIYKNIQSPFKVDLEKEIITVPLNIHVDDALLIREELKNTGFENLKLYFEGINEDEEDD